MCGGRKGVLDEPEIVPDIGIGQTGLVPGQEGATIGQLFVDQRGTAPPAVGHRPAAHSSPPARVRRRATRKAAADGFIRQQPQGYETSVGEMARRRGYDTFVTAGAIASTKGQDEECDVNSGQFEWLIAAAAGWALCCAHRANGACRPPGDLQPPTTWIRRT